ncbi:hypothetical protein LCGC14_1893060 [marine sediment metagenome]|uniref:Uncharacterized protein n=1 Tax=marine sediment metagenome TaxID=412755 RepID=A0A0F9GM63_9ZZZZ
MQNDTRYTEVSKRIRRYNRRKAALIIKAAYFDTSLNPNRS